MNCKPGDLAVIVDSPRPEHIGTIVEVLRPYTGRLFRKDNPGWVVKDRHGEAHAEDRFLRPIRDPGDDAKDEMLRPLPEEVAA